MAIEKDSDNTTSHLIHIIYASRETVPFDNATVLRLLKKARAKNESLNVTGMLLYDGGSFFQVLEGEEEVVDKLFNTISHDKRHTNVVKIIREAISQRHFEDWSMGYASVTRDELNEIEGVNDFFQGSRCLADIDTGRGKKLLYAYSKGSWRLR